MSGCETWAGGDGCVLKGRGADGEVQPLHVFMRQDEAAARTAASARLHGQILCFLFALGRWV